MLLASILARMLALADRLAFIKKLDLPRDLLSAAGKTWIDQIVRRVGAEKASEMRRHAPRRQLGLHTVFLMMREAQIIDGMLAGASSIGMRWRRPADVLPMRRWQSATPPSGGEAGTACASDSKKFGAWDGNLLTEWHLRYGGRGVMIYWHVEKGSTCVFSQLKRCSSSEVASMIKGVLRHCTDMYEAWEATSRSKRITLARKALKVSPLCADAFVLLAEEEAGSVEEVLDYYQKGVAAGEEALGPDGFEEYAGRFWGFLETRPYMPVRRSSSPGSTGWPGRCATCR